jgi:hypothetical protein
LLSDASGSCGGDFSFLLSLSVVIVTVNLTDENHELVHESHGDVAQTNRPQKGMAVGDGSLAHDTSEEGREVNAVSNTKPITNTRPTLTIG